ncbi:MAG TPA: capsular biosynthesis protein CpsI [Alphaproteobacteria bacterium]|nr:capsular biosynthesis protein CpsI [Alphaproteobacteria bacterium]
MNIFVTGSAGFIGFHLCRKLLSQGHNIVSVDNINDYYNTDLKLARLEILEDEKNFKFDQMDISDYEKLATFFKENDFDIIIHLAAQAGVRYSIQKPFAYVESNLIGQMNMLECIRNFKPNLKNFIYASSSSVYGNSSTAPFSENQKTDEPISLYAATKKSGELLTHSYSHLYNITATGLRFFTVYGEYGRPDMAYFSFTKDIMEGKPIKIFNSGNLQRDFTYIDDIVDGVIKIATTEPKHKNKVYNIGNNSPVELKYFVEVLENEIGKKAITEMLPMQAGDVYRTYADISEIKKDYNFEPKTKIESGVKMFVKWYKDFYG